MKQKFVRGDKVDFKFEKDWKPGIIMWSKGDLLFDGSWFFEDMNHFYDILIFPDGPMGPADIVNRVPEADIVVAAGVRSAVSGEEIIQRYKDKVIDDFEKERQEVEDRVRKEHPNLFKKENTDGKDEKIG
jgi:hypothetical protein